jgi:hypothetical protein
VLYVLLQNDVHILKEGDKVGASDATLLNMLNISPFSYGLLVQMVYDSGTIFEPAILDIKPEDLRVKFTEVTKFSFCNCFQHCCYVCCQDYVLFHSHAKELKLVKINYSSQFIDSSQRSNVIVRWCKTSCEWKELGYVLWRNILEGRLLCGWKSAKIAFEYVRLWWSSNDRHGETCCIFYMVWWSMYVAC